MAAFIAAAAAEFGATGLAAFASSGAGAFIINTAALIAASSVYQKRERAKAREAAQDAAQDRQVMIRSAVQPQPVVYGRSKISGTIAYAQSSGNLGQYLHIVLAYTGHECDAIETVYANDVVLPAPDGNGFIQSGPFAKHTILSAVEGTQAGSITLAQTPVTGSIMVTRSDYEQSDALGQPLGILLTVGTDYTIAGSTVTFTAGAGPFYYVNYSYDVVSPKLRIKTHLGGAGQTADADLISESGGKWTSAHVGNGVCYQYFRLEADNDVFGQIGVPNFSAVIRGKKVFDTRNSTMVWSENAALCIADWLRDNRLGLGCTSAEVPSAETTTAANICDEAVTIAVGTQKRYTCNGALGTENSPLQNLRTIVGSMAGTAVWVQGRWLVRAGAYLTPTVTLSEDDLADGTITISPRASKRDQFNRITGTFTDPAQVYASVQYPAVVNSTYKTADGGQELSHELALPLCNDSTLAQRMAKIELERSRKARTITATFNHRAYNFAPSDTVMLSLALFGYSSLPFEIRSRKYNGQPGIEYTLTETAASVFAWNNGEQTIYNPAASTTLPNPFATPAALSGLAVTSGITQARLLADGTIIPRARVSWTQSTDVFVRQGGRIELEFKVDNATEWQRLPSLAGDAIFAFVEPLEVNRVTLIRVRAVNAAARIGPWATIAHSPTPIAGINQQTQTTLVAKGTGMVINGTTVIKASGTAGWNAGVYSKNALTGGCIVSCVAPDATSVWMIGLNSDPTAGSNYTTLDFAIYHTNGSTLEIYESNAQKASGLAFSAGDTLEIEYNGACVEYRRNGVSLRVVAALLNLILSLDSSFNSLGAEARALRFSPVTPVGAQYSVGAVGYSAIGSAPVSPALINEATGATIDGGAARSYSVTWISLATGLKIDGADYDVYADSANATAMAVAMDYYSTNFAGQLVVSVRSYDEPQNNRLLGGLEAAMYRCGASRQVFGSPNFKSRSAYVLVGITACGHGNGFEAYAGAIDSDPNAWCQMAFQITQEGKLIGGQTAVWDPTGATTTTHLTEEAATSIYTATHVSTASWSISE